MQWNLYDLMNRTNQHNQTKQKLCRVPVRHQPSRREKDHYESQPAFTHSMQVRAIPQWGTCGQRIKGGSEIKSQTGQWRHVTQDNHSISFEPTAPFFYHLKMFFSINKLPTYLHVKRWCQRILSVRESVSIIMAAEILCLIFFPIITNQRSQVISAWPVSFVPV